MSAQKIQQQLDCPRCWKQDFDLRNHLQNHCQQRFMIAKITCASIHYSDGLVICLHCFQALTGQSWTEHNKRKSRNCRPISDKSFQTPHSDILQEISLDREKVDLKRLREPSLSKPCRKLKNPGSIEDESLSQLFINHLKYSISVHLAQWLEENKEVRKSLLFDIFSKFCRDISSQLNQVFKKPTFQRLYEIEKINWSQILENAEQIFDKKQVLKRISGRSTKQQNKIFKALNKVYDQYPGIFEHFKLNAAQQSTFHRQTRPLLPQQFIKMVYDLFLTKKRDCIHIALDFLIIYQSGQRFPSDLLAIQQNLVAFLENGQNTFYFHIKSTKTRKIVDIILSTQLIALLKSFDWKKFCKSRRFYERIYQILGFGVFCFRRGFLSYLFLETFGSSHTVKLLSGHRNQRNAERYYKNTARTVHLQLKNKLKVPHLKIQNQSLQNVLKNLPSAHQFTQKIVPSDLWLHKLLNFLTTSSNFDETQADYLQNFATIPIANTLALKENPCLKSIKREKADQINEKVIINQTPYLMRNGRFILGQIYSKIHKGYCEKCQTQINQQGLICQTCQSRFHLKCSELFCTCMALNYNIKNRIKLQSNKLCKLKLKMPKRYLSKENPQINQIRFLLHLRGFRYTNISIQHHSIEKFCLEVMKNHKYQSLQLDYYQEYCAYEYFPPLALKMTNVSNINGTGFGLFASKDIQELVFMGEYAADVFCDRYSIEVKRFDSIMSLHKGRYSCQSLSIGPIQYCGYICLLNESMQGNCSSLACLIDCKLKIVIFSNRNIRAGQQLTYNYLSNNQEYQQDVVIQAGFQAKETKQIKLSFGIKNPLKNCYINCILQLIKRFKHYFNFQSMLGKKGFYLIQHLQQFFISRSIYDPTQLLSKLAKQDHPGFTIGVQDDAHAFFIFVIQHLKKHVPISFEGSIYQQICCLKCKYVTSITQQFHDILVEKNQELASSLSEKRFVLENFECLECKVKTAAQISRSIVVYPEILLFYLKRFQLGLSKDMQNKKVPFTIEASDCVKYSRKFLINHKGTTIKSGHYTAIDLQTYLQYDDERVKKIADFDPRNTYMIAYQRTK